MGIPAGGYTREGLKIQRVGYTYQNVSKSTPTPGHGAWDTHKKNCKVIREVICLTSLTCAKCGTRSTLYWKILNISDSTELFTL